MEITENIRDDEERIYVSVRVKPLDIDNSDWECLNDDTIVYKNAHFLASERLMYPIACTFDRVFDGYCSTREVYDHGAKDVALSTVRGINSTVFAYGQTGSGKTYTMTGIAKYATADIYDYVHKNYRRNFILKFSAMEIYDESVRDLLSSDSTTLRLIDDPERGIVVENLREEVLRDQTHATELFSICEARRHVGDTALNKMSSRSHKIIRLTIESSPHEFIGKNNTNTLAASLTFVDLAGNEPASQSSPAGALDCSLLTLEAVIRNLSKDPNGHIPYEDSVLTRILQTSLGGNARMAIVCTMDPAHSQVEQSRNTLVFASCAKDVTTKARVNLVMSDKALVMHLRKELASLESELRNSQPGSSPYNYGALLREKDVQIEKLEKEIKDLILERDIAQSQVEEYKRILGDNASSVTGVASGHYPHFRVHNSPDSENGKLETSTFDDDPMLDDDDVTPFSVRIPFYEDNFDDGPSMFPRVHVSSSSNSSSVSDTYHAWVEMEKQYDHEDLLRDGQQVESDDPPEVKEELTARVSPLDETLKNAESSSNLVTSDSFSPLLEYGGNMVAVGSEKESKGTFPGTDCQDSQGGGADINESAEISTGECGGISTSSDKGDKIEQLQNEQELTTFTQEEKEKEIVKEDVGCEGKGGLTSWPVEFKKLQREIIELWHGCNVSLSHRTYFFLLFQGGPSDAIYLEIEMRRMKFLKDKFDRGDKAVVDGRPLTLSSSAKALRRERRTLSEQMSKKFTEQEREKLFTEWGVGVDSKLRRLQVAHLVWSKDDINHVTQSAYLVAKLIGLIHPGLSTPDKEMFADIALNSSTSTGGIYSFKRSLVSLI